MSQHEQTTPIHPFLDESDGTPSTAGTDGTEASGRYQGTTAVPEYRSGPAPVTTLVGLLGLIATISILVTRATDLDIPWGVVGPVAVVGAGVLLVVLGLAGLRGQRFRG